MAAEVEHKGHGYRLNKMPTRVQFNVARRILPVVAPMGEAMLAVRDTVGADGEGAGLGALAARIEPFLQALAALSDETCDYVLDHCLAAVQRRSDSGQAWTPVFNARARVMQFDDILMPDMLTLAALLLQDNLGGFFPAPGSASSPGAGTGSTP